MESCVYSSVNAGRNRTGARPSYFMSITSRPSPRHPPLREDAGAEQVTKTLSAWVVCCWCLGGSHAKWGDRLNYFFCAPGSGLPPVWGRPPCAPTVNIPWLAHKNRTLWGTVVLYRVWEYSRTRYILQPPMEFDFCEPRYFSIFGAAEAPTISPPTMRS